MVAGFANFTFLKIELPIIRAGFSTGVNWLVVDRGLLLISATLPLDSQPATLELPEDG